MRSLSGHKIKYTNVLGKTTRVLSTLMQRTPNFDTNTETTYTELQTETDITNKCSEQLPTSRQHAQCLDAQNFCSGSMKVTWSQ